MELKPKQVIQAHLREKGWDQAELARQLGLSSTTVSRVLSTSLLRSDSHWPAILNVLGLELVIQPRKAQGDGPEASVSLNENTHRNGG